MIPSRCLPIYRSDSPSSICGIDWAQLATLLLPLLHALAQFSVLELCLLKATLASASCSSSSLSLTCLVDDATLPCSSAIYLQPARSAASLREWRGIAFVCMNIAQDGLELARPSCLWTGRATTESLSSVHTLSPRDCTCALSGASSEGSA